MAKKVTPLKRFFESYDENRSVVITEYTEGSRHLPDNFLSIYVPDKITGRTLCLEVQDNNNELTATIYIGDKKLNVEFENVRALTDSNE